jgi:hypothetical protein
VGSVIESISDPGLAGTLYGLDPFADAAAAVKSVGSAWSYVARVLATGDAASAAKGVGADFGALSRAGDYGVWPYRTLSGDLRGTGLEAHHLIEKRFAAVMGENPAEMASVAVTPGEHQAFTNAWRAAIPYGAEGTGLATRAEVLNAAQEIYADYPAILRALGLR